MSTPYIIFQDATQAGAPAGWRAPTRNEVVVAARRFIGVEYSTRGSFVQWDEAGGRYQGRTDCLRFMFHVARDVGYLPADFDVNLSRPHPKLPLPALMWEVVNANMVPVDFKDRRPADVLLMLYGDLAPDLVEPHHVAIFSSENPAPYGSFIHCEDFRPDVSGGVVEVRMTALSAQRVHSVWRLKGIRD
jgi:hypothetical protein